MSSKSRSKSSLSKNLRASKDNWACRDNFPPVSTSNKLRQPSLNQPASQTWSLSRFTRVESALTCLPRPVWTMDKSDCRPSFNSASFNTMDSTSSRIFARSLRTLSCLSSAVTSTSWGLHERTRPSASYSVILRQRSKRWTSQSTPYLRPPSSKSSKTLLTKMLTTKQPSLSRSIP